MLSGSAYLVDFLHHPSVGKKSSKTEALAYGAEIEALKALKPRQPPLGCPGYS